MSNTSESAPNIETVEQREQMNTQVAFAVRDITSAVEVAGIVSTAYFGVDAIKETIDHRPQNPVQVNEVQNSLTGVGVSIGAVALGVAVKGWAIGKIRS